jgi:hypothetical protein
LPSDADLPAGLSSVLVDREATVERSWREHLRGYLYAASSEGRLFARWSDDPVDVAMLEHEARVREIVGTTGALRAPAVLDSGGSWLLEQAIDGQPCEGPAVEAAAAAAIEIPRLELPPAPQRPFGGGKSLRTRLRVLRGGVPLGDLRASRRTLAEPGLPLVTSHGDFHRGNVLVNGGGVWVVDWELSGRRPAGYDLMQFWATVERGEDRERLFEAAVASVGPSHRGELLRLRHALLVRTIAAKLSSRMDFDRDPTGARELLALLPAVRAEADLR